MISRRVFNMKFYPIRPDRIDKDGYYRHGDCDSILLRVDKSTNLNDCHCYCRKCHKEIKLQNIANGKIVNHDLKIYTRETA